MSRLSLPDYGATEHGAIPKVKDGDNAQDGYHVDSGADRLYEASWVLKW